MKVWWCNLMVRLGFHKLEPWTDEWCGIYFEHSHGYQVLCHGCWKDSTPRERDGLQKAIFKEF